MDVRLLVDAAETTVQWCQPLQQIYNALRQEKQLPPPKKEELQLLEEQLLEYLDESQYGRFLGAGDVKVRLQKYFKSEDESAISSKLGAINQLLQLRTQLVRQSSGYEWKPKSSNESHELLEIRISNKKRLSSLTRTAETLTEWSDVIDIYSQLSPDKLDGEHHRVVGYESGSWVSLVEIPIEIWSALVVVCGQIGAVLTGYMMKRKELTKKVRESQERAIEYDTKKKELELRLQEDTHDIRLRNEIAKLEMEHQLYALRSRQIQENLESLDSEMLTLQKARLDDIVNSLIADREDSLPEGSSPNEIRGQVRAKSQYILEFLREGNSIRYLPPVDDGTPQSTFLLQGSEDLKNLERIHAGVSPPLLLGRVIDAE